MSIEIPHKTLDRAFEFLGGRSKDKEFLVALCARCKHLRAYELPKKIPGWNPVVWLPQISDWRSLGYVLCENKTCNTRKPVFGPKAEDRAIWIWDDLTCPNCGRAIRQLETA